MMSGHGGGRHVEQNSVGVDQADLLAVARKGDRLPLDYVDTNLVGEQAHDRGVLDPGNSFKVFAPLANGNKEDVASDVFSEDGEHLGAANFGEAGGLDVASAGDAEARVAFEIGLEKTHAAVKARRTMRAESARKTRPTVPAGRHQRALAAAKDCFRSVESRRRPGPASSGGMPGQRARPIAGHTLLHAPEARLRGRFILPNQRPGCGVTLNHHA